MNAALNEPVVGISPASVCAIVISYNGGSGTLATIEALRSQVGCVLVVDNGSATESLLVLGPFLNSPRIRLIQLGVNRGIAAALNFGVRQALAAGYSWILTMDQDSLAAPDMVERMLTFADSSQDPRAVSFSPFVALQGSSIGRQTNAQLDYAITSGNLVKASVFLEIGLFDEAMFIDSVDFEFSLRLRKWGYRIYRVKEAILRHELGHMEAGTGPFRGIETSVHTPIRRYYIIRNHFRLFGQYIMYFPGFCIKKTCFIIMLILKVIFIEKDKFNNLRMMMSGMKDYLNGKSGEYAEVDGNMRNKDE